MRKIFYLVIIAMFLLSATVLADSTVSITPIKDQISPQEKGEYILRVQNTDNVIQKYSIYSLQTGQGWIVDPSPLSDKIFELNPGQSKDVKLLVSPSQVFEPGIYSVQISLQSNLGDSYTRSLKVYLAKDQPLVYLPSLRVTIDMDEKIDPKNPLQIRLFVENRNALNLSDMQVRIQSDIPEFEKEVSLDLPPLESKTVEFAITPNEFQQPKEYKLFFVFEKDGQPVKVVEKKIEVIELLPPFTQQVFQRAVFLKYFHALTATNEGNVVNTQQVKYPVSLWQGLFAQQGGKLVKEDGQRYLEWEVTLEPNQSTNINFIINYRIIIYVLLVLLIIAGFYFYVQTPVSVSKTAITAKSDGEGALSEIKVTLELRNKTKRPLSEVSVLDIVPAIANVEKSLQLGTLRPEEIKHLKSGTKVIWSLAEIEPFEHRLITYKIKAKLNILGTFSLPRASIEYKNKKGKKGKAYSNVFRLTA